jgi:hypothetical protein
LPQHLVDDRASLVTLGQGIAENLNGSGNAGQRIFDLVG